MLEGNAMKKTKWLERETPPTRPGLYECAVLLCGLQRGLINWGLLEWDGKGFLVPCPMVVRKWRGLRHKPSNAIGQRGAACGASAAPTGCASNCNYNERTEK